MSEVQTVDGGNVWRPERTGVKHVVLLRVAIITNMLLLISAALINLFAIKDEAPPLSTKEKLDLLQSNSFTLTLEAAPPEPWPWVLLGIALTGIAIQGVILRLNPNVRRSIWTVVFICLCFLYHPVTAFVRAELDTPENRGVAQFEDVLDAEAVEKGIYSSNGIEFKPELKLTGPNGAGEYSYQVTVPKEIQERQLKKLQSEGEILEVKK